MRWKYFFLGIISIALIGIIIYFSFFFHANSQDFQTDTVLIKATIKENSSYDGQIKINNFGENNRLTFKLYDLKNLASVNPENLDLNKNEIKTVSVSFSGDNLIGGFYAGAIEISSLKYKQVIPIILGIESEDVLFDSNVAVFPTEKISAGDKISAEIKIYDLSQVGTSNVEMSVLIKDFEGNTIFSEKEEIIVKDQTLITKTFDLPEDIKNGNYVLGVVLKYKNSVGTSSSFFIVGDKEKQLSFDNFPYIVVLLLIILFITLLFMFLSIYSKDRVLEELKSQYKLELKRQDKFLKEKEKQNCKQLLTREERRLNKKTFMKIRKERNQILKKVHHQRIKKVKQLRELNKKDEMKKQIQDWKKKGYDTGIFESKARVPEAKDIKKQIQDWKKKGYNTSILEKR